MDRVSPCLELGEALDNLPFCLIPEANAAWYNTHRAGTSDLSVLLPHQISEDLGSEKFCVDANQAGAGSWLKYIRVACSCDDQNLAMCQINEQVGCSLGFCPCELSLEMAPGWSGVKMQVN